MMSEKEAYVREWLDKAEHDLISARLLEIEPMVLDNVCFHCQQAVEKYLKAFLAYYSCTIEKTHNVVFLLAECSDIDAVFATVDPHNINAYAIQGRAARWIPRIEGCYFNVMGLPVALVCSLLESYRVSA